jgi:hypothetical protein
MHEPVVLSTGVFQFSHTTSVTEFLTNPNNVKDLGAKLPTPFGIAKRCLEYLDSPEFGSLEIRYIETLLNLGSSRSTECPSEAQGTSQIILLGIGPRMLGR